MLECIKKKIFSAKKVSPVVHSRLSSPVIIDSHANLRACLICSLIIMGVHTEGSGKQILQVCLFCVTNIYSTQKQKCMAKMERPGGVQLSDIPR